MKKFIPRYTILILCVILSPGTALRAQFFKQLLNSVSGTAQERANSKANQTTNKALDKVDSSTQIGTHPASSNKASSDTSANNGVLGAFAKAAAENPNDTSSADLTMKALGILTGQTGVSREDSVTAINGYKTSNGGAGIHYTYSMTTSGKKYATNKDTSQIYFTNSGEGRAEMRIPMPGVRMHQMISIGHFNQPKYTVFLYPDSKTYSLNIINPSGLKSGESYQITKIGTETVQGYSCTHSKVVSTFGSGFTKTTTTTDIWTSTEVVGYSLYKKMASLQTAHSGMMIAMENAGCSGLFVKLVLTGKDLTVEEILLKAEESQLSADMFRIPSGYSESKENMIYHMAAPPNK
jgi:hypothetical protein